MPWKSTVKYKIFARRFAARGAGLLLPLGAYCVETSLNSLFVCLCVCRVSVVCLSRSVLFIFNRISGKWDIEHLNWAFQKAPRQKAGQEKTWQGHFFICLWAVIGVVNGKLWNGHWLKLEITEFVEKTIFLWTLPNRFTSIKSVWRCRLRQCRIAFDQIWIQSYILE